MSILDTAAKPVQRKPIITICGDAGTGKTSLACTLPAPIVIRAEDGLESVTDKPMAFPLLESTQELWEQLTALIKEEHFYQTLVIDSVTALERLFIQSILESDPTAKGINQALGGYGNGPAAVAALHMRVRKACGMLNAKRGMNIVFVAHAGVETIELPDCDQFMRYSLRLGKKSIAPYVDDSDIVGFLNLSTFAVKKEGAKQAKAVSDGTRELVVHACPANVSKNRYGITAPIKIERGVNPFGFTQTQTQTQEAGE